MPLHNVDRRRRITKIAASAVLMVAALVIMTPVCRAEDKAPAMEYRAWAFQTGKWNYLKKQIPMARKAGMNRIQLSHNIIMDAQEMWEGPGANIQRKLVEKCIAEAKKNDLKVDVWVHEFSGVPKKFTKDGKLVISDELWDWLRAKYVRLFDTVDGIDGLVLTFAETQYKLYSPDEVDSGGDTLAQFVKMIDIIAEECDKRGKVLIIRTFIHRPEELAVVQNAVQRLAKDIKRNNIMLMAKCSPHDWSPYYPYETTFSNNPGFPLIMEMDSGQEYTGQSWIPHAEVEYTHQVLSYVRSKGAVGAVTRVDRYDNTSVGTLNEVNLLAFSRFAQNPVLQPEDFWREWAADRYGADAAPHVISALKRTFDITNIIMFPLQQWVSDHSKVPTYDYAKSHILDFGGYSVGRWIDSPFYERSYEMMADPDGDTFIMVAHEKELARKLMAASRADLENAKPFLKEDAYSEFEQQFDIMADMVDISELCQLAILKTMRYEKLRAGSSGSVEADALRKEIEAHLDALAVFEKEFGKKYGFVIFDNNTVRIGAFIDSVKAVVK